MIVTQLRVSQSIERANKYLVRADHTCEPLAVKHLNLEWPAVKGSRRDTAGTFQRSRPPGCLRLTETAAARDRPVTPRSETEKLPCQLDSESGPNKRVRCIVSRFDRGIGSNQNGAIPDSDSTDTPISGATFLYSLVVIKLRCTRQNLIRIKLPDRTEPLRIFSTFSYVVAHSFVKFISESDRWDYFPRLGSTGDSEMRRPVPVIFILLATSRGLHDRPFALANSIFSLAAFKS